MLAAPCVHCAGGICAVAAPFPSLLMAPILSFDLFHNDDDGGRAIHLLQSRSCLPHRPTAQGTDAAAAAAATPPIPNMRDSRRIRPVS